MRYIYLGLTFVCLLWVCLFVAWALGMQRTSVYRACSCMVFSQHTAIIMIFGCLWNEPFARSLISTRTRLTLSIHINHSVCSGCAVKFYKRWTIIIDHTRTAEWRSIENKSKMSAGSFVTTLSGSCGWYRIGSIQTHTWTGYQMVDGYHTKPTHFPLISIIINKSQCAIRYINIHHGKFTQKLFAYRAVSVTTNFFHIPERNWFMYGSQCGSLSNK